MDVFRSNNYINGDIFLKYDKSSSSSSNSSSSSSSSGSNILNWLIPGKWGHAAFLDVDKRAEGGNNYLLSASNETDQPNDGKMGRVGYDRVDGYWSKATEIGIYRVKNLNISKRRAAIVNAANYINKPWSVNTTRSSNDEFYCSKIVYRGWLLQGVEIEPHKISGTNMPWPKVLSFWRWNRKKVGFIWITYPEFRWVEITDFWVTPTDLADDNDVVKIY